MNQGFFNIARFSFNEISYQINIVGEYLRSLSFMEGATGSSKSFSFLNGVSYPKRPLFGNDNVTRNISGIHGLWWIIMIILRWRFNLLPLNLRVRINIYILIVISFINNTRTFRFLKSNVFFKCNIPTYLNIPLIWDVNPKCLGGFTLPNLHAFLSRGFQL